MVPEVPGRRALTLERFLAPVTRRRVARLYLWVGVVLVAATWLVDSGASVQANGGATEVFRQKQGPYEIAVGTIPPTLVVGNVHLTVRVVDAATMRPVVNGAVVTIEARGPEESVVGPLTAPSVPAEPWWYDANIALDATGTWQFQLTLESELGKERVTFSLLVQEASVSWGVVFALLIGVFLGLPTAVLIRRVLQGRKRTGP